MTNMVMNRARPISTWLGGAPWVARPLRTNEKTTAKRAKQVQARTIAGISEATAMITTSCMALVGPLAAAFAAGSAAASAALVVAGSIKAWFL